jgi:hypothetical protein
VESPEHALICRAGPWVPAFPNYPATIHGRFPRQPTYSPYSMPLYSHSVGKGRFPLSFQLENKLATHNNSCLPVCIPIQDPITSNPTQTKNSSDTRCPTQNILSFPCSQMKSLIVATTDVNDQNTSSDAISTRERLSEEGTSRDSKSNLTRSLAPVEDDPMVVVVRPRMRSFRSLKRRCDLQQKKRCDLSFKNLSSINQHKTDMEVNG